jgi:hypothetical protein
MNTISIKVPGAPSMTPTVRISRALRAINVRKMCTSAISLARRKSLTLAAISAASCYAGVILGCDALAFTAAFASLGFLLVSDKCKKGGVA